MNLKMNFTLRKVDNSVKPRKLSLGLFGISISIPRFGKFWIRPDLGNNQLRFRRQFAKNFNPDFDSDFLKSKLP